MQHLANSSANTSTLNLSQANEVAIKTRRVNIIPKLRSDPKIIVGTKKVSLQQITFS